MKKILITLLFIFLLFMLRGIVITEPEGISDPRVMCIVLNDKKEKIEQALHRFYHQNKRYPSTREGLDVLLESGKEEPLLLEHHLYDTLGNKLRYTLIDEKSYEITFESKNKWGLKNDVHSLVKFDFCEKE